MLLAGNGASLESMLKRLPTDAQPLPKMGWDEFAVAKTHQWIKEQLSGVQLRMTVKIADIKLIRIRDSKDFDETLGWELALTCGPERFRSFDMDLFHWPATWREDAAGRRWRGGEIRLPITEDFAKQARLWRAGDAVTLSGSIEDIFVESGTTNLGLPCGRFTTIFQDVHIDKCVPQDARP
jgi:hypothetical protein